MRLDQCRALPLGRTPRSSAGRFPPGINAAVLPVHPAAWRHQSARSLHPHQARGPQARQLPCLSASPTRALRAAVLRRAVSQWSAATRRRMVCNSAKVLRCPSASTCKLRLRFKVAVRLLVFRAQVISAFTAVQVQTGPCLASQHKNRRLTLRSTGPPTAWHPGREAPWFIMRLAARAPCRRRPVSSTLDAEPPFSHAVATRPHFFGSGLAGSVPRCSVAARSWPVPTPLQRVVWRH